MMEAYLHELRERAVPDPDHRSGHPYLAAHAHDPDVHPGQTADPKAHADALMRALLLVLALSLGAACGDHAASDPLAQLETDPDRMLAAAQPTYKATYDSSTTWSASVYRGVPQPPVTQQGPATIAEDVEAVIEGN